MQHQRRQTGQKKAIAKKENPKERILEAPGEEKGEKIRIMGLGVTLVHQVHQANQVNQVLRKRKKESVRTNHLVVQPVRQANQVLRKKKKRVRTIRLIVQLVRQATQVLRNTRLVVPQANQVNQ